MVLGGAGIVLVTAPAAAAGHTTRALDRPDRLEIGVGPAAIPDTTFAPSQRRRASLFSGYWGGTYTISTGEHVSVFSSPSYAVDESQNQKWANFVGSLLHGSELSAATLYLAPISELQQICGGTDVVGCYGQDSIVAPGEEPSGVTTEAIIAHEYGHHVAAHRDNEPWHAIDRGPKRWSSYEQVCSKTRNRQLFPGGEDPLTYQRNPGEGWAETYRVLNERKLGLPETSWDIVDRSLYPDATALVLAQQDVLDPWTSDRTTTFRGSFARGGTSTRTFKVPTPYDGTLAASLRGATGERLSLNTRSASICGTRTLTLRVKRVRGSGAFTLSVSRP